MLRLSVCPCRLPTPNSLAFFSPCMFHTSSFPLAGTGQVWDASCPDAYSRWYHSLVFLWASCQRSPFLLDWFHISPMWSIHSSRDAILHFSLLCTPQCPRADGHGSACWPPHRWLFHMIENWFFPLVTRCFWMAHWANSTKQWQLWKQRRQGEVKFQLLEATALRTGLNSEGHGLYRRMFTTVTYGLLPVGCNYRLINTTTPSFMSCP